MEFRVLGPLEVLDDGVPLALGGPKQRSVLAMLVLNANRVVSTDHLVDGLWGDEPLQRAAATLHVYVSNLRKVLEPNRRAGTEPSLLRTQSPGYVLSVDSSQVDVLRFESLVGEARTAQAAGLPVGAAVLYREALAVWRGDPIADLIAEPFAIAEAARLDEARMGAVEARLDADLAVGRHAELLPELELLVARHPYREHLRGQLMVARYRAGRQADALEGYQEARRALVDELGLEPSPELRELEAAILVQDPSLAVPAVAPMSEEDVARVLRAATGADAAPPVTASIAQESRLDARRAEESMRREIEHEHTIRLAAAIHEASATRAQLIRTRHSIADSVIDLRARRDGAAIRLPPGACDPEGTPPAPSPCPYKGLLRFEPEDAAWFYGRERQVADLLGLVAATRFAGIVGPSGSGKSSLARAGLLAALRDGSLPGSSAWPRVLVAPGRDPMLELGKGLSSACRTGPGALAARLVDQPSAIDLMADRALEGLDGDARVVILVDQFEELFTTCTDSAGRERFVDVLTHAATAAELRTSVVVAMRAEYFGHCADHPDLAGLLRDTNMLVGPMRPDELQRAIEEPADRAGLTLEPGLVERIFEDVGTEPGALPLMETALLETWLRRRGHTLTLSGYDEAGGVRGAVAHLAEGVYDRMTPDEQRVARGIFLRLAEPDSGLDDVRRRAPLEELMTSDGDAVVLATLVEHRLVVTSDSTGEVAHEALLREWPRLRSWLEEDREGRRMQRALADATQVWNQSGQSDDLVFRGARLAAADEVAGSNPELINPLEHEFLAASHALHDTELHRARRTARRMRTLSIGLVALLVAALAAGGFALVQRTDARHKTDVADARHLAAEARAIAPQQRDLALLLAVEGYRLNRSVETRDGLATTLVQSKGVRLNPDLKSGLVGDVNPDGVVVVGSSRGGKIRFGRIGQDGTFEPLGRPTVVSPNTGIAVTGAFDPTGTRLASVSYDGMLRIFDVRNPASPSAIGDPAQVLSAGGGELWPPVWNHDSTRVAVGYRGGVAVYQVDARGAHELLRPRVPSGEGLAFSPTDPDLLVVKPLLGSPLEVDLASGTTTELELAEGKTIGFGVAFNSAGTEIAVPAGDGGITLIDTRSGQTLRALAFPNDSPYYTAFNATGTQLAASGANGIVVVWDTGDWSKLAEVETGAGFVPALSFLPDGRLVAFGDTALAVIGRPDSRPALVQHRTSLGARTVLDLGVVAGAGRVALVDERDGVRGVAVVDPNTGHVIRRVGVAGATALAVTPNGSFIAVGTEDGHVKLLRADTLATSGTLTGSHEDVLDVAVGGGRLAAAGATSVEAWDIRGPTPVVLLRRHLPPNPEDVSTGVAIDPAGHELMVNQGSRRLAIDLRTGRVLRRLRYVGGGPVAFDPADSSLLAAGGATPGFVDSGTLTRVGNASAYTGLVPVLAFSPDGALLVTGGLDSSIALADVDARRPIGPEMTGPKNAGLAAMAFRPDRPTLLVAYNSTIGANAQLLQWDLDLGSWSARACQTAGRNLTLEEWDRELPGRTYHRTCAQWPAGT